MIKRNTSKFVSIAEVVYYSPNEGTEEAMRLNIEVDLKESVTPIELPFWLEEHREQIAKSIVKAAKSTKGESKFRFVKVSKIPYYLSDGTA